MNEDENRVVEAARRWIGTPYAHQASLLGAGCDCLGLLRGLWRELVGPEPIRTPAYSSLWADPGREEPLLDMARLLFEPVAKDDRRPGDVLVFRLKAHFPAKHCGLLSGPDRFIHAYEGAGVIESPLNRFWRAQIAGTFRFPENREGNR